MNEDKKVLSRMIRHIQAMPDDPFTPLYDEYLIKRLDRNAPRLATHVDLRPRFRPGKRLSPSGVGGCERAAVFQFAGLRGSKRVDPRAEAIFETGDWYHHKWQAVMRDMELVLGPDKIKVGGVEMRVKLKKLYILGYLDVLICLEIDGRPEWVLVDIKSINSFGFRKISNDMEPLDSHREQVTTYAKMVKPKYKLKYGAVLYENKDTSEHEFLMFPIEKKVWSKTVLWCERVLAALNQKKIPPKHPECEQGNFQYERCPHKALCWGNLDKPQINNLVYKDFPGVDALWEAGLAEEEQG